MSTRTRSRYPSPGSDSTMWWDDGRPTEPVIVLATSRHKRKMTPAEALPLLEAMWDEYGATADPATAEIITWRSVTLADMDTGLIGESTPGDWSTEGGGSAWVQVLRCDATPALTEGTGPMADTGCIDCDPERVWRCAYPIPTTYCCEAMPCGEFCAYVPAPSTPGEGDGRPGGWVPELGAWIAWLRDLDPMDLIWWGPTDPATPAGDHQVPETHDEAVRVVRWADGSTPQPPVPPQETERPDTAALLTIGDWLLRTLPGHQGAEQTAAALAYTARWIDAQPPVPPTPASQPDDGLRAEISVLVLALWNACTDGWADGDSAMASYITAAQEALSEGAPDAATAPSAPVERPAPGQFEDPASGSLI